MFVKKVLFSYKLCFIRGITLSNASSKGWLQISYKQ